MRIVVCFLIFLASISSVYGATIYKWTDEKGVVNVTDEYSKIPPAFRNRVEIEKWEDPPKTEIPPPVSRQVLPQAPSEETKEIATDIYGQDEAHWKDKVRPWKERLEEARANYAKAESKFMEKSEELSRRRYGSPTQYKFNIIELDGLREEMAKHQREISEASETLDKISKEAEEAKVNPDWLK